MSKEGEHECPICGKKIQGKKYCSSECAHIAQKDILYQIEKN